MNFPEPKRPQETPYDRLKALGIALPAAPPPIANFVTHVQEGKLLFLSGQGPSEADGSQHTGKVGASVTVNGCSDLMVEVFGPQGVHARSAVGHGSLPGQITVEIEAVVAID
jgi:enamine deaminase RidA (YjgF/YER057c/UK114 family)